MGRAKNKIVIANLKALYTNTSSRLGRNGILQANYSFLFPKHNCKCSDYHHAGTPIHRSFSCKILMPLYQMCRCNLLH